MLLKTDLLLEAASTIVDRALAAGREAQRKSANQSQ